MKRGHPIQLAPADTPIEIPSAFLTAPARVDHDGPALDWNALAAAGPDGAAWRVMRELERQMQAGARLPW